MSDLVDSSLGRGAIVLIVTAIAIAAVFIVRKRVPPETLRENNDFVGFVYTFVGVVYGVYLAFVAVIVWEHFDATDAIVAREAEEVNELWRDAGGLPDPSVVRPLLREYADTVVKGDWPRMGSTDAANMPSEKVWGRLWEQYASMRIRDGDLTHAAFLSESLRVLNDLASTRRQRTAAGNADVPPMMWAFVISGGIAVIVLTLLLGVPNRRVQVIVTGILTALLVYAILIVAALADPFSGQTRVEPAMFINVIRTMDATRLR